MVFSSSRANKGDLRVVVDPYMMSGHGVQSYRK